MKVLWLENIPAPYRVKFFNELGKYCDLTVVFEKTASSERDESWKDFSADHFNAIFLKGKSVGVAEAFCPSVRKYLKKGEYDHIVVMTYADPTGMLAVHHLKRKKIPYEIEGDGAFARKEKGLKRAIKKYFLRGAERYFSTAEEHDRYYLNYGIDKEKIVRYPFTSLYQADILNKPISREEKLLLKKELGLQEEKIIIAVGQFIHRKGYDILIRAMAGIKGDVGCYIIGGTPPQEYLDLVKECGAQNVRFVDFKKHDELKKYYQASDVFVHPTREDIWGLVINEAMANGLPIVTTDKCIAGLELVREGENGFIVPTDDVDALLEAMEKVLQSDGKMSEQSLKVISRYSIEAMAKRHIEIWEQDTQGDSQS